MSSTPAFPTGFPPPKFHLLRTHVQNAKFLELGCECKCSFLSHSVVSCVISTVLMSSSVKLGRFSATKIAPRSPNL